MTPKKLYFGLLCLGLAVLGLSFYFYGYENTWRLWNIPLLQPPFLDFLLIPGSAESIRAGYNPAVQNPFDPQGRIFNYPQIWYLILRSPIDSTWTVPLSLSLIILFFISAAIFPGKLDRFAVWMLLLILFSSALMLGVERANVDLIFFSCLTLALILSESAPLGSFGFLMLSVLFKVYPIFGVGYFLKFEKKRALKYIFSAIALTSLYFVVTYQDMLHVFSTTMKGDDLSYGWGVLPLFFENRLENLYPGVRLVFLLGMLGILFRAAALAISRRRAAAEISGDLRNLSAFWLGAGIYTGTFMLGNNWDYRLMFLLFTVPQLAEWAQQGNSYLGRTARIALMTLVVSCWYSVILGSLSVFTVYGHMLAYLVDEFSNWTLFSCLVFLFVYSLPDWVFKDYIGSARLKKAAEKSALFFQKV